MVVRRLDGRLVDDDDEIAVVTAEVVGWLGVD